MQRISPSNKILTPGGIFSFSSRSSFSWRSMESLLRLASVSVFRRLDCSSVVSPSGGGGGHEMWACFLEVAGILNRGISTGNQ